MTWNRAVCPILAISLMLSTIGPGSLVMKTMQSTLPLVRSTLWTVVLDTGLRTRAYPALSLFIIHSEWKAGMSVRRLADMIICPRIRLLDLTLSRRNPYIVMDRNADSCMARAYSPA